MSCCGLAKHGSFQSLQLFTPGDPAHLAIAQLLAAGLSWAGSWSSHGPVVAQLWLGMEGPRGKSLLTDIGKSV